MTIEINLKKLSAEATSEREEEQKGEQERYTNPTVKIDQKKGLKHIEDIEILLSKTDDPVEQKRLSAEIKRTEAYLKIPHKK